MIYTKSLIEEVIEELRIRKAGSRREEIIGLLKTLNQKNHDDVGGMELWLQTWVFSRLFKLIPELKKLDAVSEVSAQ